MIIKSDGAGTAIAHFISVYLFQIINIGNITGPLIGGFISEFTGSNRDNMLIATFLTLSAIPIYLRFHNHPAENEKTQ